MKNQHLFIAILIAALACALAVTGWSVLPETLVVQVGFSGETGNTMAKPFALALPTLLAVVFAFLYARNGDTKHLVVSLVGILVLGLTFAFNL